MAARNTMGVHDTLIHAGSPEVWQCGSCLHSSLLSPSSRYQRAAEAVRTKRRKIHSWAKSDIRSHRDIHRKGAVWERCSTARRTHATRQGSVLPTQQSHEEEHVATFRRIISKACAGLTGFESQTQEQGEQKQAPIHGEELMVLTSQSGIDKID